MVISIISGVLGFEEHAKSFGVWEDPTPKTNRVSRFWKATNVRRSLLDINF